MDNHGVERMGATGSGFSYGPADEVRRRGVRRMKLIATGFLLVATVVYGLSRWAGSQGAGAWTGYVAAAAEAGMVGGLADWFAVTALFKRPLGLPIPHTAIIPTRKDVLGRSLGDFVGENFLAEHVVRTRLRAAGISAAGERYQRPFVRRRCARRMLRIEVVEIVMRHAASGRERG